MSYHVQTPLEDINAKLNPMRGGIMPNDMHDLQNPGPPAEYNLDTTYHHMSVPTPQVQQIQAAEYIMHTQQQPEHPPEPAQEPVQEQPEPQYDSGFNEFFINQAMMEQFSGFSMAQAMESMASMDLEMMVDMEP